MIQKASVCVCVYVRKRERGRERERAPDKPIWNCKLKVIWYTTSMYYGKHLKEASVSVHDKNALNYNFKFIGYSWVENLKGASLR